MDKESGNVVAFCRRAGMTRQNYYAKRKRRQKSEVDEGLILEFVRKERHVQPCMGGRKVKLLISCELENNGVLIGRDRFFDVLRKNGLLIERKKPFIPKTTNSRHSLPLFHNLIAGQKASASNQIWVSDLTYIRTEEGFIYGSLTTDAYSRKIVGAHAGDNLEAEGCIKTLQKALKDLPGDCFPTHHSDRGCQYCCHAFVDILNERHLPISMTESNHCYENAMAERVNGILKQEYGLYYTFKTKEQAIAAFYEAVELYNNRRPHMGINYMIPAEVHRGKVA